MAISPFDHRRMVTRRGETLLSNVAIWSPQRVDYRAILGVAMVASDDMRMVTRHGENDRSSMAIGFAIVSCLTDNGVSDYMAFRIGTFGFS